MKKFFAALSVFLFLFAVVSCGGTDGDTIDGFVTESISLYDEEQTKVDPTVPDAAEAALLERVQGWLSIYYGEADFSVEFDPSEREDNGGEECYVIRSRSGAAEGMKINASVESGNVYGFEPSTGITALIWCEGWTAPDFSYFGEKEISGL